MEPRNSVLARMSTILDMIKRNAVPAAVMRTAAKGALPVPADQMMEILVYLTQNPVFAQDAKMTLAGFDLISATSIISNSQTAPEVLGYFWSSENRRPALMAALIENPAIPENLLIELAMDAPREIVTMLLASPRARASYAVTEALVNNPNVLPQELRQLRGSEPEPSTTADAEAEAVHQAYEREHAAEIAAEEGKAFQLIEGAAESDSAQDTAAFTDTGEEALETSAQSKPAIATAPDPKKLTLLQRLGRMTASERVKAAFTAGREERGVLIRDGARVVQNAVLASPKLTEPEVEVFAAAKNVHENVLREIARNRRFMKNYSVMRNLVLNPKTPLDVALPMVKMLMVYDLKALQRSRNVSETIRSLAAKYYREKALSGGRTKE
jgi:hypothetical protein